jgi:type IV pilus assembly protein PilN
MYSLDINFLNDRAERAAEAGLTKGSRRAATDPRPYYIGAAIAIALPLFALGFWLFLQNQNRTLAARQAELDNQLSALQAQLGEVNKINTQIQEIEAENQALASVFDYIKPWSAILQDVRSRVPNGVQIANIEQIELEETAVAPAPSPSPSPAEGTEGEASPAPVAEAPPAPPPKIAVSGVARSFNDVNDFVLTLQRSPFLQGDDVKLVSSQLIDNPTEVEFATENGGQDLEVQLPQVVQYRIESSLTNLPASELLQDLERTLSVGLASRIQALRDRGVLQK